MQPSSDNGAGAQWPDRFVYMCSAGGAAIVNLAPMLQAGAGPVTGVVILVGLSNPNDPTPSDIAQALNPAGRLRQTTIGALGIAGDRVVSLRGNADLIGDWVDALATADRIARETGASIVFNVTGGRVPQKIGVMTSLARHTGQEVRLVSVGLGGTTIRLVEFGPDGIISERPLPPGKLLSIADYLHGYGVEEDDQPARLRLERAWRNSGAALAAIRALIYAGDGSKAFAPLLRAIGDQTGPLTVTLNRPGYVGGSRP